MAGASLPRSADLCGNVEDWVRAKDRGFFVLRGAASPDELASMASAGSSGEGGTATPSCEASAGVCEGGVNGSSSVRSVTNDELRVAMPHFHRLITELFQTFVSTGFHQVQLSTHSYSHPI